MKNYYTFVPVFVICSCLMSYSLEGQRDHDFQYLFGGITPYELAETSNEKSGLNTFNFRTIDGSKNNFYVPNRGKAHIPFERLLAANYKNDGWSMIDAPNARMISNRLCTQTESVPSARGLSAFILTWLQFLDHDITITKEGHEYSPIEVPQGDEYFDPFNRGDMEIPFTRVGFASNTGTSAKNAREQINEITAWIDGSGVYGSDQERADWLRSDKYGKLKVSPSANGDLPPCNTKSGDCSESIDPSAPFMAGQEDRCGMPAKVFVLGDIRGNEQPGLTAIHTLMIREHNRICDELVKSGKRNDEENYQYARKIVGGLIQSITYNEVLPALGVELSPYRGWSRFKNPNILNEFATAGYRLGHTMVTSDMYFRGQSCDIVDLLSGCGEGSMGVFGGVSCTRSCTTDLINGEVALRDAFFNPSLIANNGLEELLYGLANQVQEEVDLGIVDDVRNFLFGVPGSGGLDLAAMNIQRGRDHGLQDFNAIRAKLRLNPYSDFDEITSDQELADELRDIYGNVNNIDAWIGFLAEDYVKNGSVGPTLAAMLKLQFDNIRKADRFWFENDHMLGDDVRADISGTTLAGVIMRNTDLANMDEVFFAQECKSQEVSSYCPSSSHSSANEWINLVQFGKHAFSSGGSERGYHDLTQYSVMVEVSGGSNLSYSFRSKDEYRERRKYWSFWIDLDQNGVFSDDELMVAKKGYTVNGRVLIPSSAKTGVTRMRVSMSGRSYNGPCDTFDSGEVEDYALIINKRSAQDKSNPLTDISPDPELILFPNPVSSAQGLRISYQSGSVGPGRIRIVDITGQVVYSRPIEMTGDTDIIALHSLALAPGFYTVVVGDGEARLSRPLVMIE